MALVLADRVRDTTTTTGTGTVTLSGTAPTGYQNFSVVGDGNTTYYTINAASQWEVGIGTYSSTGPTLSRTTVLASSNGGALVDFAAGTKDVFVTYPAEKSVNYDDNGQVVLGIGGPSDNALLDVEGNIYAASAIRAGGGIDLPSGFGNYWRASLPSGAYQGGLTYNGGLRFYSGDVVSERMRLDTSGNLGIGTSSVTAVWGTTVQVGNGTGNGTFSIVGSGGSGFMAMAGSNFQLVGRGSTPLQFGTNDTIRATIDTSGNLGIGTSSPGQKLEVIGSARASNLLLNADSATIGYADNSSSFIMYNGTGAGGITNTIRMVTNGAERMRINSSGEVLVNTTTTFGKLSVYGTTGFNADANAAISGSGSFKFRGTAAGTTITTYDYLNYTAVQFIRDNGNPTNTVGSITCTDTATTYNTSSDRRLKKDIVPAGDAGATIDAIEIVSHGWKASEGTVPFGVIAQDLHAVAPQAVHAGDDGEEVSDVWGVDYSKLVPMLIKEVQSLRARVAQLEGK